MTYDEAIAKDLELFQGPRGGWFFYTEEGIKVWCRKKEKNRKRKYKPRRGAYNRFILANDNLTNNEHQPKTPEGTEPVCCQDN